MPGLQTLSQGGSGPSLDCAFGRGDPADGFRPKSPCFKDLRRQVSVLTPGPIRQECGELGPISASFRSNSSDCFRIRLPVTDALPPAHGVKNAMDTVVLLLYSKQSVRPWSVKRSTARGQTALFHGDAANFHISILETMPLRMVSYVSRASRPVTNR